eukprot:TRINITY_DN5677_c1_g3_i1.p1 TRINITY_DN5677_c1_g3~~TRINITY_DN5677_c1_g3_i1.p1  ORF type:complete len:317 (+),score=-5.00 TRINITY_DN5677_c1_g3_i1:152-1102(+)
MASEVVVEIAASRTGREDTISRRLPYPLESWLEIREIAKEIACSSPVMITKPDDHSVCKVTEFGAHVPERVVVRVSMPQFELGFLIKARLISHARQMIAMTSPTVSLEELAQVRKRLWEAGVIREIRSSVRRWLNAYILDVSPTSWAAKDSFPPNDLLHPLQDSERARLVEIETILLKRYGFSLGAFRGILSMMKHEQMGVHTGLPRGVHTITNQDGSPFSLEELRDVVNRYYQTSEHKRSAVPSLAFCSSMASPTWRPDCCCCKEQLASSSRCLSPRAPPLTGNRRPQQVRVLFADATPRLDVGWLRVFALCKCC